jgi:hypothetical protein
MRVPLSALAVWGLDLIAVVIHCGLWCGLYQGSGRAYYLFYSLLGVVNGAGLFRPLVA